MLRDKISKKMGFHMNDAESISNYFERLSRGGQLDSKARLTILTLVCEHIDKEENKQDK